MSCNAAWQVGTLLLQLEPLKQVSGGLGPSQLGLTSQGGGACTEISVMALCVLDPSLLQSLARAQSQTLGW